MLPCANFPDTERAKLKRPFQPVLMAAFLVSGARPDSMACFSISPLVVANALALQAQVVHLGSSEEAEYRFLRRGVNAPERLGVFPSIVEQSGIGFDRLDHEGIDPPRREVHHHLRPVMASSDVRTLTIGHEAAVPVIHLLPPEPKRDATLFLG